MQLKVYFTLIQCAQFKNTKFKINFLNARKREIVDVRIYLNISCGTRKIW